LGAGFIPDSSGVGYDGGQNVRDEEQHEMVELDPTLSEGEGPEERASRVPRLLAVLAVLSLAGVVVGVIVYGYLAKPGWIGVADKKFWDYLELLIVPAVIAIGVFLLDRSQRRREQASDRAQREREQDMEDQRRKRELATENQRAMDDALQA
jgi:hypothetical protein